MSEIEKMYENAGINPLCQIPDMYCGVKNVYEDFTAEKQIELIKWLIVHSPNTCLEDEIIVSAFEDSLANIINTIWKDLSEEEKQQIQRALE